MKENKNLLTILSKLDLFYLIDEDSFIVHDHFTMIYMWKCSFMTLKKYLTITMLTYVQ